MKSLAGVLAGLGITAAGTAATLLWKNVNRGVWWAVFVLSLLMIVACVTAILRAEKKQATGGSVTSYNQSGGVTAHNVNLGGVDEEERNP